MEHKETFDKIYYMVKKHTDFSILCEKLDLKDYEAIGLINLMKDNGYNIDYINGQVYLLKNGKKQNEVINIPTKNGQFEFIAISDNHYASKWDNPHLVEYAYEVAEKNNCQFVTNSGDMIDGDFHGKRPDHIYQVRCNGLEQIDYFCNKYPKSSIPTYFIDGNHDATFIKTCGADVGKLIIQQRPDLTYLGADLGDINVDKVKIRLRHGSGGNAYAKGYKLQKYCETLSTNDLPDIILQGHYHYSAYFKNRDIHCFNVPALQGYTPYAKAMGLPQEMGFWDIKVNTDSKGNIVSIEPELYQFEETKKRVRRK